MQPACGRCFLRLLFAGVFVFLPLLAQAESGSTSGPPELDSSIVPNTSSSEATTFDLESELRQWAPFGNPYNPSSPTNFEAFIPSFVLVRDWEDRNRLSAQLHESASIGNRIHSRNPSMARGQRHLSHRGWKIDN